jgi:galactonate dehydratase
MKITGITTLWLDQFPNICWTQVKTDTNLIGLGETYFGPEAVSSYLHETVAPYLLGKDPLTIDKHSQALDGVVGFNSISAEMRGNSSIDMALWDIFGQSTGLPIYQLLGGLTHEKVKVYNTCAGYSYNSEKTSPDFNLHTKDNLNDVWGIGKNALGPYEDIEAFHNRPGELARSLLSENISAMKIWPFDQFADRYNGQWIDPEDLEKGVRIFREIREAVGDRMEIALEMHMKWSLPAAKRIAAAVEPYQPLWFEDPIKADNLDILAEFARSTRIPLAASELLATRRQFIPLLEKRAAGILIVDISWCGGISEAKKIATMAEAYHIPVAAHDCTGPVSLMANSHFSMNVPNLFMAEFVRAYYSTWYRDLVTELPRIENGYMYPSHLPGLGTRLKAELFEREDAHTRTSLLKG